MILEHIPCSLPRERWHADHELLDMLCRLHRATAGNPIELPDLFVPAWTDQMTGAALRCFPAAVAAGLEPLLRTMQRASDHLFQPWCAISGDPNPANWGIRGDGLSIREWRVPA